jgi:hypothetical protein
MTGEPGHTLKRLTEVNKAIKKGLFGPHIWNRYRHVCTGECSPAGGIHVIQWEVA